MDQTIEATPSAPEASAVTAPETPQATVAANAQEPVAKKGFLSSLFGANERAAGLANQLAAEQSAHAATRQELTAAQSRIAEFEAMEQRLEQEAQQAAAAANQAAEQAAAAAAQVPAQVASQVADVVATLGVPEEALAPVQTEPAAKGQEFASLTGRARAAAAFNAQFQK